MDSSIEFTSSLAIQEPAHCILAFGNETRINHEKSITVLPRPVKIFPDFGSSTRAE
ncbi:hypothetical protein CLU79DRAFT_726161 [Phycomyces nitens]|nr:hypothetical protein CLU79DRAFT_726161 [Phycomyces nitens]